jgi:hypothetical protein
VTTIVPVHTEDARVVVATLEMSTGPSRPCGTLVAADGSRTSFSGWAEFAAVIEAWRIGRAEPREEPRQ